MQTHFQLSNGFESVHFILPEIHVFSKHFLTLSVNKEYREKNWAYIKASIHILNG